MLSDRLLIGIMVAIIIGVMIALHEARANRRARRETREFRRELLRTLPQVITFPPANNPFPLPLSPSNHLTGIQKPKSTRFESGFTTSAIEMDRHYGGCIIGVLAARSEFREAG